MVFSAGGIGGGYFLDALYTETMLMLVGFGGSQLAPWLVKGIFSAGIYHGDYDKRCFFTFADADFDKRIGAVPGGFHCIVHLEIGHLIENQIGDSVYEKDKNNP